MDELGSLSSNDLGFLEQQKTTPLMPGFKLYLIKNRAVCNVLILLFQLRGLLLPSAINFHLILSISRVGGTIIPPGCLQEDAQWAEEKQPHPSHDSELFLLCVWLIMLILSFDTEKLKSNLNMIQTLSWDRSTECTVFMFSHEGRDELTSG